MSLCFFEVCFLINLYRSAEILPLRRAGVADALAPSCSLGKSGDKWQFDEDSPSCVHQASRVENGRGGFAETGVPVTPSHWARWKVCVYVCV